MAGLSPIEPTGDMSFFGDDASPFGDDASPFGGDAFPFGGDALFSYTLLCRFDGNPLSKVSPIELPDEWTLSPTELKAIMDEIGDLTSPVKTPSKGTSSKDTSPKDTSPVKVPLKKRTRSGRVTKLRDNFDPTPLTRAEKNKLRKKRTRR